MGDDKIKDHLRIMLKFKDRVIHELQYGKKSKVNFPSPEEIIDEKEINEVIAKHQRYRDERIDKLETLNMEIQYKNKEILKEFD